jgi:uncharacterized protein (DUF697 family)
MTTYETETGLEFGEASEFGEAAETEDEQFLGSILGGLLGGEVVSPLSEAQEVQLASELLEVSSEEELEQFLGGLIKKVGGFIRGPVGQALGGVLKSVAKKALPVVGGALGSFVAPGVGTAIGSKLGSMASNLFEMELESMSQEQAQFEAARRVVGLTAAASRMAAQARPRPGVSPHTVARAAVAKAARAYAPGLQRQLIQSLKATAAVPGVPRPGVAGQQRPRPQRPGYWSRGGLGPAMYVPVPGVTYAPEPGEPQSVTNGGSGDEPFGDSFMEPRHDNGGGVGTSGRWIRRGRRIVLFGA